MHKMAALTKTLNTAQREAVETLEGPVMVVAGPGTGKTHVLTLRIANILQKTDTPPDGILALTFTESGATTMRRRLAGIVGAAGYRVRIHTFHGYCKDVITRYPEEFPRIIGSDPISDIEKIDVLSAIITAREWAQLKPFGNNLYYLQSIKQSIGELKRENISPDNFAEALRKERIAFESIDDLRHEKGKYAGTMKGKYQTQAKRIERTEELLDVYRAYESELATRRRYDFEDMIMEVISAMERDTDLRLRLQEECLYILADEHQDANAGQNRLLELLSDFHESPNLFVVGDEKQAIFRFQGATLDNFMHFKKVFPTAKLITLTESYRSGQVILDAAHTLAAARRSEDENAPAPVPLTSQAKIAVSGIELRTFSTPVYERAWLASHIAQLIGEGVEPSEIAVLSRTNSEVANIARVLESNGIAVSVESDQNALADPEIRHFLTYLRATAYFGEDELLALALNLNFSGVSALDAYKVIRHARKENMLVADVLSTVDHIHNANVTDVDGVHAFYTTIESIAQSDGSVPHIVEKLIEQSGFLAYALSNPHAADIIEKLGGLVRDIETLAAANPDYTLRGLAEHLALLDEHRISVNKANRAVAPVGSVRLMTAHKSKGMEFAHVFIVNLVDGAWGGKRNHSDFELPTGGVTGSDEDERRLLYVALTRAKHAIYMSYARESATGTEKLRSRLLEDIDPTLITTVPTEEFEEKLGDVGAHFKGSARKKDVLSQESEYLRGLFKEQGLSVTALNSYLTCPWRYFYSSLIRIPKSPTKEMVFGTAAHAALRRYFDSRTRGDAVEKATMLEWFADAMRRAPLSRSERTEAAARGETFLSGWYDAWHETWPKDSLCEYRMQTELLTHDTNFASIRLRGDLDKIEFLPDGVNVVDYKTGHHKTRNDIQGKTANSTGDYWRQLVFYKILLQAEGKYRMVSAELDFLQPDDKGRYHKEKFIVEDTDTEDLTREIIRVATEIDSLAFWDRFCDEPDCEYCALRKQMV